MHQSVICTDVRIKEDLLCLHMEEAALAAEVTAAASAAVADRAAVLAEDVPVDLEEDVPRWVADRRWEDRLHFITITFSGVPDGDGDRAITAGEADVSLLLW